jgi:hypothetical protein
VRSPFHTILCGRPEDGNLFCCSTHAFSRFSCNCSALSWTLGSDLVIDALSLPISPPRQSWRNCCSGRALFDRLAQSHCLVAPINVGGTVRSVAPLCPACHAALAAGHHGCARTCQAPICLGVLGARNRVRYCLKCLDQGLPITPISTSRRDQLSLRPRSNRCARTLRRHRDMSFRMVDFFARHQRPGGACHFVRQSHSCQPDRAALQNGS